MNLPERRPRTAVIGGGLSGLATAFYLKRLLPTAEIQIFEAKESLGGVIGTETVQVPEGEFVIDVGADMFATDPPAALQLCDDLQVTDQLLVPDTANAGALVVHQGNLVPIPDGFVLMRATKMLPMLTTSILSWRGKMRLLTEGFVGPIPEEKRHASGDVSVGDFVRHRMGQEVLDNLVGPLVAGIYTADIEKLSLNATMRPIAEMVRQHGSLTRATLARRKQKSDNVERNSAGARYQKFRGFPNGMKQLIDTLAESVGLDKIHTNSPVASLNHLGDEWNVQSANETQAFDQIVLATPSGVTAKLLSGINADEEVRVSCEAAAKALGKIQAASTAIVVLGVRKSQIRDLPRQFGFVVPSTEGRQILAVSFASHKYPIRCPDDHCIIRVFVGGALQPELLNKSDEELVALVRGELSDLIGMQGIETLHRVVRWNDAMPQYHVGHDELAKSIDEAIDRIPGLLVATNALHGVGISPVIANAKKVARQIQQSAESSV